MSPPVVLVVEDNDRNRKLVRDVLTHAGMAVLEAVSGEEGVEAAGRDGPDLVLMDLQLPGIDGFQALQRLRAAPATATTPVVALTAFAMPADRERVLQAGFDGYLHKPITVRTLPEQVRSFLPSPAGAPPGTAGRILVVDDVEQNRRLLEAVLAPRGHTVVLAASGEEALELVAGDLPDLVLLDVRMPGLDGLEVCRRLRSDERTAFLPVVMVTATDPAEKVGALEAGADDFVSKPFDRAELLARIGSLLRVKRYHDTIERQAAELAAWSAELERRVDVQVAELERAARLRRFLAPQLVEAVMASGGESVLDSHRREITAVFCDLRGFTAFAELSEPEEVMRVLGEYHQALGEQVHEHEGTLERFAGDGLLVFFNDPIPCPDPAARAVRMALAMQRAVARAADAWSRRGHDLALGIGIAHGYATLGRIGFEGRADYAAIGTVTNLAARLSAAAGPWQTLVSARVRAAVEHLVALQPAGDLDLRGFARPVPAFAVTDRGPAAVRA